MVWQLLSMFSPFLLAFQTTALLVKWSATETKHRNPFCIEQTQTQKNGLNLSEHMEEFFPL